MIKAALLAAALFAVSAPAMAQTPLPSDPGLRSVSCSAILSATALSMGASGGAMAEELTAFAGRWKVQARALLAGQGKAEADTDALIAQRIGELYKGPGQGLPKGTFVSAQICQAEAEPLPAQ